jgi:hypothetical protein
VSLIASLVIGLEVDQKKFDAGLNKATNALKGWAGGVASTVGGAITTVAEYGAALGAAAAFGVTALVKTSLDAIGETDRLAKRLGVATDFLEALEFAAEKSHISVEAFQNGLQKFASTLAEAQNGSQKAADAFGALGIKSKDLAGMGVDQAIGSVADGLSKLSSQSQKIDLVRTLFGRGSGQLVTLLSQGREGIARFADEAQKLGLIQSPKELEDILSANEGMKTLELTFKGVGQVLAADVAPYLAEGLNFINAWAKGGTLVKDVGAAFVYVKDAIMFAVDTMVIFWKELAFVGNFTAAVFGGDVKAAKDSLKDLHETMAKPPSLALAEHMDKISLKARDVSKAMKQVPDAVAEAVTTATNTTSAMITSIEKQISRVGQGKKYGSDYGKIMDLKDQGASQDSVDEALSASRQLKLTQAAQAIKDADPFTKWKTSLEDLSEMTGLLDFDKQQEQAAKIEDELRSALGIKLNPLEEADRSAAKIARAMKEGLDPTVAKQAFKEIQDNFLSSVGYSKSAMEELSDRMAKLNQARSGLTSEQYDKTKKQANKDYLSKLGIENPMDEFKEKQKELQEALARGLEGKEGGINASQYAQGITKAQEGLGTQTAGAGAAATFGSKEAYSAILQAQYGGGGKDDIGKKQLAIQQGMKAALDIIAKKREEETVVRF